MSLSWSIVSELRQLEGLSGAWAELLARSGSDEPMLSPAWLLPWWRGFGGEGGRELRVGVLQRGARLVALVPLLARWHWYTPGIPFRRLELLGTGEPERDEVCSEYLNVIAERGAEEEVATAFAEALVRGVFGPWDEIVLGALDGTSALPGRLADELRRRDARPSLEQSDVAMYVALPATWEAYLSALPAASRYLVTRSLRDFQSWAGDSSVIHHATTRAELVEGRRALVALHADRWGDGGSFASPRFDAFHEAVMPELFEHGALDLSWMCAHGAPVAALYNVRWRDKIYHYQSGRRLDVPKPIRLGIVMHARAIQRAIEGGMREYDFLGGTSQYKRKLATHSRPLVRLRAVRRRLRETARVFAAGMKAAARLGREMARARARSAGSRPTAAPVGETPR